MVTDKILGLRPVMDGAAARKRSRWKQELSDLNLFFCSHPGPCPAGELAKMDVRKNELRLLILASECWEQCPAGLGFQAEQWDWVQRTFPGETAEGVLEHLKEELVELEASPFDPEELADVFLLVQCLASHAGVDLMTAARAKLEKCKGRKWRNIPGRGFRTDKQIPA